MARLVAVGLTAALLLPVGAEVSSNELYEDVVPADTADCLDKVSWP